MKKIILILVLFVKLLSYSQNQRTPCASDDVIKNLIKAYPEIQERLVYFENSIIDNNKKQNRSLDMTIPSGSITIPVVVYIVHDSTTLTNISDTQVNNQLIALNNYFFSTGIKFCLATKAGSISPIPKVNNSHLQTTPGIIHINNSALSNHTSSTQQSLVDTADPLITKEKYLRMWVVKSIDGIDSGILGYSMFPNTSTIFDGIVMRYDVFGNGDNNMLPNYNLGKVLVHEVGHYLGLYHTFEGGCTSLNSNCSLDGDRVCDTPPVAVPNFNCINETNSCIETPQILDDITNYMDYGNNVCQDHFSTGQVERMINVINLARSNFLNSDNIIYTGTCGSSNLLSAKITPSNFSPCTSSSIPVTFSALTAQNYSWNFGDAFSTTGNPNTANTQNASHIFTSATNSPYTVTLTVTNSAGQSAVSIVLIYVTDCSPIINSNSYWYVDSSNGLNFSSGKPVFDPSFPTNNNANLSCNSQCDANGNLLFYNNKSNVWNRQHVQINSTNLTQNTSSSKSNQVLIVAKPPLVGNTISEYYIFTQQGHDSGASDSGFRYSLVNVNGTNATMGLIGQPVTMPSSYGFDVANDGSLLGVGCLSAVKKCNSNDYWIITVLKKGNNPYLVVFSLTNLGLTYNSDRQIVNGTSGFIADSSIEIAPNGNKLLLMNPYGGESQCYMYDFNKAQGIISSDFVDITIPLTSVSGSKQITGHSFSPDSNLLYLSNIFINKIYQFNINSTNINNTRKDIFSSNIQPWYMQVGPDNKLYVGMTNSFNNYDKLSVIHTPNKLMTFEDPNACGFSLNGPIYPNANFNTRVGPSLPNVIDARQETAYFDPNTPNVISKYITGCNTYKFFPNVCGTSFIWNFTNTTTGVSATSTDTNPTYIFSQNGIYTVTVRDNNNIILGTSLPIEINSVNSPLIEGSQTACLTQTNANITNNSTPIETNESVTWSVTGGIGNITGLNNQSSVNINWTTLPGTITLTKISLAGCTSTSSKTITAFCPILSNSTFIEDNFIITPNPSTGIFTINTGSFNEKTDLKVIDMSGRLVFEVIDFNNNKEKIIDLSNCQSGVYFVKFSGVEFTFLKKIIKK